MKHLITRRLLSLALAMAMVIGLLAGGFTPAMASETNPSDNRWDIPLSDLSVSCGYYEPNGTITSYEIKVSDDGENFTIVASSSWPSTSTATATALRLSPSCSA